MNEPNAALLPRPITLLVNTHSRKGRAMFQEAVRAVKDAGIPVAESIAVKNKRQTEHILKREIGAGSNLIIVGGGDGTLSSCANYLANTPVAMGVLPLGTGNTFARSLGLPLSLDGAAQAIAAGHIEAIDVGRVNGQVFLNSVTIGLSCEIAGALDKRTKKRLGLLAWPVVGGKVLLRHRAIVLKISSAERTFHVRTHQLVIANGRYVAGPIAAAPDASVQSQQFNVFTLGGADKRSVARAAWQWLRGQHMMSDENRYFTTAKLRVEAVKKNVSADVDGEINQRTPLELEVLPGALRVVVPKGFEAEKV